LALSNDYEMVLRGLAAMLAPHAERVEVVEISTDPHLAADVDVILYDTFGRLPDGDGKLGEVVTRNDAKVLVYSWDAYPERVALAGGAVGYVHKGVSAEALVEAVVAAHEGRPLSVPRPATEDGAMPSWPGQEFGLSAREAEMLTFLARGLTNHQIAARSFLSVNTVKTYLRTAYVKIGAASRSQAVAWAIRHGLGGS
jgi:DNA-binding NarL/FixJ family response regulator